MPRTRKRMKRRGPSSRGGNSMQSAIIKFTTVEVPFRITQASSGTGGLTSATSLGSYTAANSVNLDPYNIGGRFVEMAALFTKYSIKSMKISYVPDETSSGVLESVAGATATPTYGSRAFAWGINRDPAMSTLNYNQLIQMGGRTGNTSKSATLTFKNNDSEWFFTSTTAGSPTTIDLRLVSPLQLRFAYFNTSTTAAESYGHLVFRMNIHFQGSVPNSSPLGLTLSGGNKPTPSKDDDEFSDIVEVKDENRFESKCRVLEPYPTVKILEKEDEKKLKGFSEPPTSKSLNTRLCAEEEDYENPLLALSRAVGREFPTTLQEIIELQKLYRTKLDVIDGVVLKGGR